MKYFRYLSTSARIVITDLFYLLRLLLKPTVVSNHGIRLLVKHPSVSNHMCRVFYHDRYEGPELDVLSATLATTDRVLEIGGGVGYLSVYCARVCGNESVVLIEANPEIVEVIHENHVLNSVKPTIIPKLASTDDHGEATLFLTNDFWSATTESKSERSVIVPKVDTNNVIRGFKPTFLIVDVEGAEKELIPQLELNNINKVLIEIHPNIIGNRAGNEVIKYLIDTGFSLDLSKPVLGNTFYFSR